MTQAIPLLACTRPGCTHQAQVFTPQCPACGAFNSLRAPQPAGFASGHPSHPGHPGQGGGYGSPVTPNGPRILNTKNTVLSPEDDFVHTPCGDPIMDKVLRGGVVLGREGVGTSILFCGEAGVGKTTWMLKLLFGLSQAGRRGLYITAEQEARAVLATAKLFGFESEHVDIVSVPPGPEALRVADQALLQTGAQIAVYDSIQKMKVLAGDVPRPLTRILVSRLNKFGEAHGEREQEHDPDVLLWADYTPERGPDEPRRLYTSKNRHGQLEEAFYWLKDEKIWSEKEWKLAHASSGKKKK